MNDAGMDVGDGRGAGRREAGGRRRHVRRAGAAAVILLVAAATVWGQDLGLAELRRMYDDVVAQLKLAQERKLELAADNERLAAERDRLVGERDNLLAERQALQARCEELQRSLAAAEARAAVAEEENLRMARRTWTARSLLASFESFLDAHPDIRQRWARFVQSDGGEPLWWYDRDWPLTELSTPSRREVLHERNAEETSYVERTGPGGRSLHEVGQAPTVGDPHAACGVGVAGRAGAHSAERVQRQHGG